MSDNEEEMSNNDSILNSVKTEPSDILNDSIEHHRNSFPTALLGIPGNSIFIMISHWRPKNNSAASRDFENSNSMTCFNF